MKASTKIAIRRWMATGLGWMTRCPGQLRILTYHSIQAEEDALLHVRPGLFEEHMRVLADAGYRSLRVSDIAQAWPGVVQQKKRVAITFDDGLLNNWTVACPILRKYGLTATFFLPAAALGQRRQRASLPGMQEYSRLEMLSWDDVREMATQGFEIGAHSMTHVRVSQQTAETAQQETLGAKGVLEGELGRPVRSFAYPKGHRDSFASWTRQLLREAGYTAGCTQMGGPISSGDDLLELPRNGMTGLDDSRSFRMILSGQYDVLKWIRNR